MEVDTGNALIFQVAQGAQVEQSEWPDLRDELIERIDKNAHHEFTIPKLPPPEPPRFADSEPRVSPLPSSPAAASPQESDKDREPQEQTPKAQSDEPALPKQLADMLVGIVDHLRTFNENPPHTIQRLAELALQPRAHYRALASYLHAVDRVVQVTSGTNTYPLPLAVPDMSAMHLNGEDGKNPAEAVAWTNPATAAPGTDEALGGALLTPIPWLTRRSPEGSGDSTPGAQIHSESTETIDGPNGMGSIETVSVSVNGIPSTGHARGITQGELLRQEQRAGVVPVSQLSRQDHHSDEERVRLDDDEELPEDEETPHARGPEEIGVGDTGLQSVTTSHVGEGGLEMQDIDVEAAVGRKHEDEDQPTAGDASEGDREAKSPSAESTGTKRAAEKELAGEPAKKVHTDDDEPPQVEDSEASVSQPAEESEVVHRTKEQKSEESGDKMDLGEDT